MMTENVISLSRHFKAKVSGPAALAQGFSSHRRDQDDVFWLKENAEFLSISECTGQSFAPDDLEVYGAFYRSLPDRLSFFPQYYRFLTSIALDLEALGVQGTIAEQLCHFVQAQGLAACELSDLQRGEAMRLLARRGIKQPGSEALRARLHSFMENTAGFAIPNRKAAYELTHIVFYLSEYGRRDPELSKKSFQSLMFTGILAYLEENADLLSEVCVALRYGGQTPPAAWEQWIASVVRGFDSAAPSATAPNDHYHEFLVANWALAQMGATPFRGSYASGGQSFFSPVAPLGALRAVSEALFELRDTRRASWDVMQGRLLQILPEPIGAHLGEVAGSCTAFAAFFAHFARPARPHAAPEPATRRQLLERVQ